MYVDNTDKNESARERGGHLSRPVPESTERRSLEVRCQELLAGGVRSIVINFEETELINSIGISILLGVIEAVNESRGTLVLSNLSATNRELFEMLGLLMHVR